MPFGSSETGDTRRVSGEPWELGDTVELPDGRTGEVVVIDPGANEVILETESGDVTVPMDNWGPWGATGNYAADSSGRGTDAGTADGGGFYGGGSQPPERDDEGFLMTTWQGLTDFFNNIFGGGSGSAPTDTGADRDEPAYCYSGGQRYNEGHRLTSIINPDGTRTAVADAYYICRNGEWVISSEGLPPQVP